MADPISWSLIIDAAILVGTIGSASASIVQSVESHKEKQREAEIAEKNALLQQQQMEYNERIQKREAAVLEAENAENARRMRQAAEDTQSQRLALLGKSGAALSSGSPLAILGAAAADEELAIQDSNYSGARQVGQLRTKATDYGYGAAIAKQNVVAARAARPSGVTLGATILGDVSEGVYKTAKRAKEL